MTKTPAPKSPLTVEEADESFATWADQPWLSAETRQAVLRSNLLIVPTLGFLSVSEPVFPVCTEELFQFLKEKAPPEVTPEICIEDKDYKELALHSALLIIGGFVVSSLVAPVVADLIAEYIKRRAAKEKPPKPDATVKVELTVVEENGRAAKFSYEGPSAAFRKTLQDAIKVPRNATTRPPPRRLPPAHDGDGN